MNYDEFLAATDEIEVVGCIKFKNQPIQYFFEGLLMHMSVDDKTHLAVVNALTDDIDLGDIEHAEELKKRIQCTREYNDLGDIEAYDITYHTEDGAYTLENNTTLIVFYEQ